MRNQELMVAFIFFLLPLLTHGLSLNFNQSFYQNKMQPAPSNQQGALVRYAIQGYQGLYLALLRMGQPSRDYHFIVDTGSDVPWIKCSGPGGSRSGPNSHYTTHNNFLPKTDPFCPFPLAPGQRDRCECKVTYGDGSNFDGLMVRDYFRLYDNINRRLISPSVAFGCGTYTGVTTPDEPDYRIFDGLLGLGRSRFSFPSQLRQLGLTRNFHGHCLSRGNGGFGFVGLGLPLSPNTFWLRMKPTITHYFVGPATLSLDNVHPPINNIELLLDSGTTYTHFNATIYRALYDMVQGGLSGTPLSIDPEDRSLPVCWKLDHQDITSIDQVKRYFKPIKLDFTGRMIITLQPEDYLFISKKKRMCFGILTKESLGDLNILGATSMREKLVIYDNERGLVGWSSIPGQSCAQDHRRESDEDIAFLEPGFGQHH